MEFQLTELDKKVLSYCSRGISRDGAAEKIAKYFDVKNADVSDSIKRLKNHGFIIENKATGVTVLTTSPLKVKSSMLDKKIVENLADKERSAKASGFKKHTFNVDTGEIEEAGKKKEKKKETDLGFDVV
jgi:hypothetical protein